VLVLSGVAADDERPAGAMAPPGRRVRREWIEGCEAVSASRAPPENFREKYRRSAMENARQLQCKALHGREKSHRRGNNGKQWQKQCAEQWKQSEIRARAYVPL
jgi:hypothetical protein